LKEPTVSRSLLVSVLAASALTVRAGDAPPASAPVTRPRWEAQWIAHPEVPGQAYSVQHFRRVIELKVAPKTWAVHVSADPRCRLFVNDVEVWTGPARSDLEHWPFVTLDLGPHLRAGVNVLGATVWNHGEYNPWSQISHRTAFLLQGDGPAEAAANTGAKWKVFADASYSIADKTRYPGIPTGRPVRFDARTHPWGWTKAGFDDRAWVAPELLGRGATRGVSDAGSPWWLVPQAVPALERVPQRFAAVARFTGPAPGASFVEGREPWLVPANASASRCATICRAASPNPGHMALVAMEKALAGRFTLITQNVDGLHVRAGSSPATTFQIHGNIERMRCAAACTDKVYPLPAQVMPKGRHDPFLPSDRQQLRCPACGGLARPHVLWFDEIYNETYYRFSSSLEVAAATGLLIVAGTSGATNLPNQVVRMVRDAGGVIIDINIAANPFSQVALASGGFFIQHPSAAALPVLAEVVVSEV